VYVAWKAAIHRDEIPGGLTCENYGPHPVTFYSHSERRAYMRAHGLREVVRHVPVPGTGASPHTTSWSTMDAYTLDAARALADRQATTTVRHHAGDDGGPDWDWLTSEDVDPSVFAS
jgi:hypothetical protein